MVKSTYALTLFAAVSLAAPLPQGGGGSGGHGNLIGAGTAGGMVNDIVEKKLLGSLTPREGEKGKKKIDLVYDLPIVGALLGKVSETSVCHIGSCD